MKKKLPILAILIAVIFAGCKSEKNKYAISDLNADFTATENLDFKYFKKYDIPTNGMCHISDSILWHLGGSDRSILGSCYDINSGEKLSAIAMFGKANYEFTEFPAVRFMKDSIQFSQKKNTIKTFAIKDIIENKPMNERPFSTITTPDSICVGGMIKLQNGSVVATIMPPVFSDKFNNKNNINNNSIAILNNSEVNAYQTINFESYNIKDTSNNEKMDISDKIRLAYAQGQIATKGNDLAVFSVQKQFILYTFDLNNKNIVKEKKYTQIQDSGSEMTLVENNDKKMEIYFLNANDNYIFCHVRGYLTEAEELKEAIFVFDWELNPIKRFNLPKKNNSYCLLSGDCKYVYLFKEDANYGIEVSKADLNLE